MILLRFCSRPAFRAKFSEGEIAIAKGIEAGREIVIAGLCESPLTFQAIIIWRNELNEGKVLLRDIVDLDATYGGPDAKTMPMVRSDDQLTVGIAAPNQAGRPPPLQAPTIAPVFATPLKPAGEHSDGREMATERMTGESNLDDDEMENWLSVAAIEAELKPKVVKTFDTIAGTYKRLRRLQDQDIQPGRRSAAKLLTRDSGGLSASSLSGVIARRFPPPWSVTEPPASKRVSR